MKFLYPVPRNSVVTQTFAEHVRRAQVNGWTMYNGGVDWGIPTNTAIKAAQHGTVTVTRSDATGYGTHVRLEHTEGNTKYTTIYAHLMRPTVSVGDRVSAGDLIGRSDNTGNSTGPHLHFELRKGTQPIDPAPLLVRTVAELDGGSGDVPAIEPPDDVGTEPKKFPRLNKALVVTAMLNIRTKPSTDSGIVGTLLVNAKVAVIRKVVRGDNIWLQIGYEQYIAMKFDGFILAQWA